MRWTVLIEGSTVSPDSMRATVTRGSPARNATSRWLNLAHQRAARIMSATCSTE